MNLGQREKSDSNDLSKLQVFKPQEGEVGFNTLKNGVSSSEQDDDDREDNGSSLGIGSGASSLDIFEFLNTPHLRRMAVSEEVQEWIV